MVLLGKFMEFLGEQKSHEILFKKKFATIFLPCHESKFLAFKEAVNDFDATKMLQISTFVGAH